ncbi:MAG: hypothetical protein HKL81_00415 [Acidimicrobiaceae bacterium]|nr:hypothetical protein [Acidimicrobiaceae bacterium]
MQKDDLVRQIALLESYGAVNDWTYEVADVGFVLSYSKSGQKQLVSRICSGDLVRRCDDGKFSIDKLAIAKEAKWGTNGYYARVTKALVPLI